MTIFFIIFLALVASWLDMIFVSWWPAWLMPIWIWVGIQFFALRGKIPPMWFWILSCGTISLFSTSMLEAIVFIIIYGLGGTVLLIIYKKYLSSSNLLIILAPSLILLVICQILLILATHQIIMWALVGRICVTMIISIAITYFYDPQKEKKKYI